MRTTAEHPIDIGREFIIYAKGQRVLGVELKGARSRNFKLRRVLLETLKTFTRHMRGIPQFYALDLTQRKLYLWPQSNYPMAALVDVCETEDEYREEMPIEQDRPDLPETVKRLQDCNVQGLT